MQSIAFSNKNDSLFRFTSEISLGYSAKTDKNYKIGGISPGIRLMWEPNKKLNIGIESTFMQIEKHFFNSTNQNNNEPEKANLNAIPILLVFNMEIWKMNFYGSVGASYVWTRLDTKNDLVISSQWNYTIMLSSGYTYYFNEWIGIGIEGKYYLFTKLEKQLFSINIKTKFCLLTW